MIRPQDLLCPKLEGLYCAPGDFYIDPTRPVARAVITHGHADHARAGHVLGAAQAVVRWKGLTMVVSGDYKRRRDPTCPAFEPVPCDVFISEATFGLPVFRHPPDHEEIARLL